MLRGISRPSATDVLNYATSSRAFLLPLSRSLYRMISADDQWMWTIRHCPFTCLSIIVSTDRLLIARVRYVPETVSTLITQAISHCIPCVRLTKVRGTAALKAASASR